MSTPEPLFDLPVAEPAGLDSDDLREAIHRYLLRQPKRTATQIAVGLRPATIRQAVTAALNGDPS